MGTLDLNDFRTPLAFLFHYLVSYIMRCFTKILLLLTLQSFGGTDNL